MKSCIIYNGTAGSSDELAPLLDHCVQCTRAQRRPSAQPGAIRALARAAIDEGFERIVVAGGDGTVSEAINGIAPDFERVALAVLPFGTGNDFARSLGIPLEEEELRAYLELKAEPVPCDIVSVSGGVPAYFANAANGGLGGSVAKDIDPESKDRWGPAAYWFTALSAAMEQEVYRVRVEFDAETIEEDVIAIAIANGRFVGGGFRVAPDALLDDGLLDVTLVPPLPVVDLAASGVRYALDRAEHAPQVRRYHSRRVRIQADPPLPYSIDGEAGEAPDAAFEILPQALRVIPGPLDPAFRRQA